MIEKILINASNLHVGGGVQVAVSFINELSNRHLNDNEIPYHILISTKVFNNLSNKIDKNKFKSFHILDIFGFRKPDDKYLQFFKDFDICFTIFGPLYFSFGAKYELTGFAQPWIAYPNNLAYDTLSLKNKIKNKILFKIKDILFRKSEHLIVEANHIKLALVKIGYNPKKISVVSNAVSSIYNDKQFWEDIDYLKSNKYTLGFIGRNYTHKNIARLTIVSDILKSKYNTECDFLFTLTDDEMLENGFNRLDNFKSVGSISVNQCPYFYNSIDALIFPSLLECFSASPIEAMKMNCLVIASDLPFIRDVCKSSVRYFDPLDNESIALAIYESINNDKENKRLIKNASKIVGQLPNSQDRAESYLKILTNINNL